MLSTYQNVCHHYLPIRTRVATDSRQKTGNTNKLIEADNHLWEHPFRGHWMTITQKEDSFIARADTLSPPVFPKGSQFLLTISQNHLEADVS